MEMAERVLLHACTPQENLQNDLLKYLRKSNDRDLKFLLEENRVDVNFEYDNYGLQKTALLTVCMENSTNERCIQLLLDYGANVLYQDELTEKNALYFAAENNNPNILNVLLKHLENNQIDVSAYNLYYTVIQCIKNTNKQEDDYIDIVKMLLKTDIDINVPDKESGWTAIYMAAKYNYKEIVSTILNTKNGYINLDDFKDKKGKTARDLITENNLFNGELKYFQQETYENLLFRMVRQKNEKFEENYVKLKNNLDTTQKCELLLLAVNYKNIEAVATLLDNGVTYNSLKDTAIYDMKNPFILACVRGYYKILKLFLECSTKPNSELMCQAMIELQKTNYKKVPTDTINHKKCTDLLLKYNNKFDINYKDPYNKNTALHLAARYQSADIALQLLDNGASLACRDSYGKLPIADLTPKTIERHLNNCISYENEELSRGDKCSCLNINLTSLLPPRTYATEQNSNNIKMEDEETVENEEMTIEDLTPETEVLQYMCQYSEMREFLKHPVILAFIYLKWHRIRMFFYFNLLVYSMFIISLITYITISYNTKTAESDFIGVLSYVVAIITFVLLIIREFFQMFIFKLRYFQSIENWLELCLLVITGLILLVQSKEHTIRQLSAIAIVLSAIEFLLLVGQFPGMSTNIMMLRTVSFSFFKLLCWYSILLLAFAYSFFTLFQETELPQPPINATVEEEEEQDFFEDPGMSLLKTIIMLTGEFDAQSIKFSSYPIISHLIFVLFVFLIAIVLFNLLNGLAVSDTQIIKNDAQLYGQLLKVEHIAHIERVLLRSHFIRVLPMLKQICLFPLNCQTAYLLIYPNQDNLVTIENVKTRTENITIDQSCFKMCTKIYLDKSSVRSIRELMQNRDEENDKIEKDEQILREMLEKILRERNTSG